jgi:hypothetical protein
MTVDQLKQAKQDNLDKAFLFAKELVDMTVPGSRPAKKTIIISTMAQHNLNVRDARKVYADVKQAKDKHNNHKHVSKKEN